MLNDKLNDRKYIRNDKDMTSSVPLVRQPCNVYCRLKNFVKDGMQNQSL